MIDFKYITILVLVLLGGPLYFTGFFDDAFQTKSETQTVRQAAARKPVPEKISFPDANVKLVYAKPNLRGMFAPDELNNQRKVSLKVKVSIDDLLKKGETPPKESLIPLYIFARAPQYMNRYCQDIVASIGTKCAVARTHPKLEKDNSILISATLFYTPSYDTGKPFSGTTAEIRKAHMIPHQPAENALSNPDNTRSLLKASLKDALLTCTALKQEFGNCVIASIALHTANSQDARERPNQKMVRYNFLVHTEESDDTVKNATQSLIN